MPILYGEAQVNRNEHEVKRGNARLPLDGGETLMILAIDQR
jgi:hypothetical protein